ncbi:accessory gene regulator B family protein [Clostridium paraputrificum]|uniref:accessory gene regulator B family protein n=1 Tax=Clostridium TaxID=1485 RepID=UPI003D32D6F3
MMLQHAIKWNVNFITQILNIEDKYEIDRIRYGVETLLGELIKTLVILFTSILTGNVLEFFIVFLMMSILRSSIGGTHAKSYLRCLIRSVFLFYLLYFVGSVTEDMPSIIQGAILVFETIVLLGVEYKTKIDSSGANRSLNIRLRIKLLLVVVFSALICKLFFNHLTSLLLITQLYIIIDYLYMKRSVIKS